MIAINIIALVLMSSDDVKHRVVGVSIIIFCYLFLLLNYTLSNRNYENYRIKRIGAPILSARKQFKVKKIATYKVNEGVLTEEKWEDLKLVLNSFALEFLHSNFPDVEWDSQFYLIKYDGRSAGVFVSMELYKDLMFTEKPMSPILLNESFLYAVIKFNDFGIIKPVVEHELVHYALWKQGKKFGDNQEDFENKLLELNVPSNNPENSNAYGFGIERIETENGIEDTLSLVIPPSKSSEKDYKHVLEKYINKCNSNDG
jgi:hypothetical protein